jgi:uncharacterized protein YndB with AHSA1/START domain
MMNVISSELESLQLSVTLETRVNAPIETTFQAVLDQLSTFFETPEGVSLSMKLEPWPGGRWYRDLGDGNGHFWGNVQAIKRPNLIELSGPLFMSYPVSNNVQYKLREENGATVISFQHKAFGLIDEGHRKNVVTGWTYILEQSQKQAEGKAAKTAVQ